MPGTGICPDEVEVLMLWVPHVRTLFPPLRDEVLHSHDPQSHFERARDSGSIKLLVTLPMNDLSVMLPEPDVRFVAICDIRRERRERIKKMADAHYGR